MSFRQPLDVYRCPLSGTSLIEASAGTGKTWAICALFLRLLAEKNFSVGEILVLTFTRAAAAELRDRLRLRLSETLDWFSQCPEEGGSIGNACSKDPFIPQFVAALEERGIDRGLVRSRLKSALASFDEAFISTIHGFCQRMLADNPFAAALPFEQELLEEDHLTREVVADYWRQYVAHGQMPPALTAWLLSRPFNPVLLRELLRYVLARPMAKLVWPDGLPDIEALPEGGFSRLKEAFDGAALCWRQCRGEIRDLLQSRLQDLKNFDLEKSLQEWDIYLEEGEPFGKLTDKGEALCASILRNKKTRAKKQTPEHPFFDLAQTLRNLLEDYENSFEMARLALFRHFITWAGKRLEEQKRRQRQAGYDDLLSRLHQALLGGRGRFLAGKIRKQYPAALIDEFQDTDPLQFDIFQRIYEGGAENSSSLFFVGDPKQAIYSFRQADLYTYMLARQKAQTHYRLDTNQRSSSGMIAGINAVFMGNPHAFMMEGLDFPEALRGEKPLPPLEDESGLPRGAFHFWQLPKNALDKPEAEARSAKATAEEIARLLMALREGRLRVGEKPLASSRIAVLVRTRKQGEAVRRALLAVGVSAAELSLESVFSSEEAKDLECLLFALLEPGNAGFVKAALSTTLFGLTANELAYLEEEGRAGGLDVWLGRFGQWGELWKERGIRFALNEIRREAGLETRLLSLPNGERRLTNYLHLVELMTRSEGRVRQPIRLFRWFLAERNPAGENISADNPAQLRLESDQDLVRIITIHSAKGLEYDIVFCPFLWEGLSAAKGERLPALAYHNENKELVLDFRKETLDFGKAAKKKEEAAERLRLYYVAMTRAVHRCYLVWGEYLSRDSRNESARSLMNWLVAGETYRPDDWLFGDAKTLPQSDTLFLAWQKLIARCGGSAEALPEPGQYRLLPLAKTPAYQAAGIKRQVKPSYYISSFSGLSSVFSQGASLLEERGGDDDEQLLAQNQEVQVVKRTAEVPENDILHFPSGARAGNCIHDFFERLDFGRRESWREAALAALNCYAPGDSRQQARYLVMLENMAENLFATPICLPESQTPFYLQSLKPAMRLIEMEFHLPVARLEAHRLLEMMAKNGEALQKLDFPALKGFLKGFIDLIFIHEGRYYVLDWKSNHLGFMPEDYAEKPMRQTMFEHSYALQAYLYLLALHRFLKFRLPDYDPARHLGGACYLFIRGVRSEWRQDNAAQAGIYLLPPKVGLVLELEKMLEEPLP